MAKVELGFINTPYTDITIHRPMTAAREESRRPRRRHFRKTMTAEDIGAILEDKYHILDVFWKLHQKDVLAVLRETILSRIKRMLTGRSTISDRTFTGVAKPAFKDIEKAFRNFLDKKEMDALGIPGVPTKASLIGTTGGKFKTLRPGRPSFVATGIYRASFRVWIV
jgi:hypothetical protein